MHDAMQCILFRMLNVYMRFQNVGFTCFRKLCLKIYPHNLTYNICMYVHFIGSLQKCMGIIKLSIALLKHHEDLVSASSLDRKIPPVTAGHPLSPT